MGYGFGEDGFRWGFSSVEDWLDSVILSFPAPWIIGDDTHYGTEIYDNRAIKVMSIWMAFGRPSARQQCGMTDAEWDEYCCDSHWESETQWHLANAIVKARNYIDNHDKNKWFGETDRARSILRTLIMQYGRWQEEIDVEIACGGPLRRITSSDPSLPEMHRLSDYGKENRRRDRERVLEKMKAEGITRFGRTLIAKPTKKTKSG